MRRAALTRAIVACAAGAFALTASGGERPRAQAPAQQLPERTAAYAERPQTELPPLPAARGDRRRARGGRDRDRAGAGAAQPPRRQAPPTAAPKPDRAASASGDIELSRPSTAGDGIRQATALPNGIALPPLEAPEAVRQMIEAGNVIARTPYLWGGGHGKWVDTGYDCSGSVSFVLASAGYLEAPLASGPLMSWGAPGPRQVGDDLLAPGPRVHGGGGDPLRHLRRARDRIALAERPALDRGLRRAPPAGPVSADWGSHPMWDRAAPPDAVGAALLRLLKGTPPDAPLPPDNPRSAGRPAA